MNVAITSCNREPQYVLDTLRSMYEHADHPDALSLRIVVDGDDSSYLGTWSEHADARAAPFGEHEHERRIFWTTARALSVSPPGKHLLVCQDDLEFAPHWDTRLVELLTQARLHHGSSIGISLWCRYPWTSDNGFCEYTPAKFYGSVAMFYANGVIDELRTYMQSQALDPIEPDDMAIKRFFAARPWCTLLAAVPNLVQHVGDVSTRGDIEPLRSPIFAAS